MQEALNSGRLDICVILHQPTICRDTGLDKNQDNSNRKVIPKASDAEIQLLKNSISEYQDHFDQRYLALCFIEHLPRNRREKTAGPTLKRKVYEIIAIPITYV
ncbi:hypothetical protein T07_15132 [Trichinella nelsoni]|uniref:Uncharacterized protein n=1 Tax=Trichinella nelsoni TaxID=6336 RepID=A0A0V0SFV4_9BILA|nr:hypothetical protein T07_15132 [Trichinella nelsoni]